MKLSNKFKELIAMESLKYYSEEIGAFGKLGNFRILHFKF